METLATNEFWILGLIILAPLVGAIINGIIGHKLPRQVVWFVACAAIGTSFAAGLYSVSAMWSNARLVRSAVTLDGPVARQAEARAAAEAAATGQPPRVELESRYEIATPKLVWTPYEWITSGDWTDGDTGYVPTEQFEIVETDLLELCCAFFADRPDWATECELKLSSCLGGVYTPDSTTFSPQAQIEGTAVFGDLQVEKLGEDRAMIRFTTFVETQPVVNYGKNAGNLGESVETPGPAREHAVVLDHLIAETTYFVQASAAAADGSPMTSRLYALTLTEPQLGIGGVRARLRRDAHRFGSVHVEAKFVMDALSAVMVLIITGVGFLIHLYSIGYMRHDASKARFFSYLNLFCCAMLILVLGGNLIVMFVGWEGVGLCSYLLIGYYYESHANADAGKKAFIVNRVGDFAFMIGVMTLFFVFGTLDFTSLEAIMESSSTPASGVLITLSCILLFIGCTGKSAQIPLYVWLPDAMAGPTPVSALIHAATMVTAGVYLVARLNFLFIHSPTAMLIVAVVGGCTALFAATIALVQTDIKKVLAYSTVSQLGYMFLAVGVGAWWVGIFHLMTHAFFKALLFLGSGSVIDAMHHEQDIMRMGGLRKKMPITAATFFIGCLAIAGVPLLSGFFSKDQILWYAWFNNFAGFGQTIGWFLWGLGTLTAGLTAFYMFRLYFLTFEGESRVDPELEPHVTESPTSMVLPLVILAFLSAVAGYIGLPHLFAGDTDSLEVLRLWLIYVLDAAMPHRAMDIDTEHAWEWVLMGISVGAAALGIFIAYSLYIRNFGKHHEIAEKNRSLHRILYNKYYVDELYEKIFVRGTLGLGVICHKVLDAGLIDRVLIHGAAGAYAAGGWALKYFQNGDLQRYAAYIVLGIVAVLYLVMF